ncbi:MAG TPA: hypothetical protein VFY91_05040, partial [Microbacterium sp.]|nr:hypothetical protein [Microbacterium sp.]
TVGGAIRAVRAKLGRGRRTPWLAAAGVAGVIVVAGALWPTGDGPDPSARAVEAREIEQPADPSTSPTPVSTPSPSVATGEGGQAPPGLALEAEAGLLLDRWAACVASDDASCRDGVLEQPAREPADGAIGLTADARTVTMLDDYGGAAVLRVEAVAGDVPPQLIVLVQTDDGGS